MGHYAKVLKAADKGTERMSQVLEYRLARKIGQRFIGAGERYPTAQAARDVAPAVNRERATEGKLPLTHILTLPKGDTTLPERPHGASHFLGVEALPVRSAPAEQRSSSPR
jgi:hypothetical protein